MNPMKSRPFKQVDVFTATAYYGNPLAVVIDGQVFVADLQGCDDELCYYDYPTGVA